jgi:parallel beta-helix repeat protein
MCNGQPYFLLLELLSMFRTLRTFLGRAVDKKTPHSKTARAKNRFRHFAKIGVEVLEDRLTPAATFYVDDLGSDYTVTNDQGSPGLDNGDTVTWHGAPPVAGLTFGTNAFTSIQQAINAASPGDTVNVAAGTYSLSAAISVNKRVTLLGAEAGVDARTRGAVPESIIDASALTGFPSTAFAVQAGVSGAIIDGFKVQGAHGGQGVGGIYLVPGSNGTAIRNNIITDNHAGIFVANNSNVNQTIIERNLFLDNTAAGPNSGSDIYADHITGGTGLQNVLVRNNSFTNSTFEDDSWAFGLSNGGATAFANITFSNNAITNHGRGVYFFNTNGANITGNTFTGVSHYGLGVFGLDGVPGNAAFSITNNAFTPNSGSNPLNAAAVTVLDDTATGPAYQGALTLSGNQYTVSGVDLSIDNESATSVTAVSDTFNGVLASSATTAQQFAIVDTILDAVDASVFGLVRTKANNVYVTPNSFISPLTVTPDIGRAIAAAGASDTINIQAGSYTGDINTTTKAVTLSLGAGPGQVTITGNLILDSNDTLFIEIAGTNATSQYDNLVIPGSVTLGNAALVIDLVSFNPTLGDPFIIINKGDPAAISGSFANKTQNTIFQADGRSFQISYTGNTGNDVVLTSVNVAPTLTSFAAPVDTTNIDTQVELTFAELAAQGNEADVDGTVTAFVVQAVTSGTLKIGTSAGTATPFAVGTNDTIDATRNAYWTPGFNARGQGLNAFTVVAKDNSGALSTGAVQVPVNVNDVFVYIDFGANGFWRWSESTGFQLVHPADVETFSVGVDGFVYIDFGIYGLYRWAQTVGFQQIHPVNPENVVAGPDGFTYIDFGVNGFWRWSQATGFLQIHPANVEDYSIGTDGFVYIDFGIYGLYRWSQATGFFQIHAGNPEGIQAGADGFLYVDFGAFGFFRWSQATQFQQIHAANVEGFSVAADGFTYIDFGSFGLYRWSQATSFQFIHPSNVDEVAAAAGGFVFIDFGSSGLWRWSSATGFLFIHPVSPQRIRA